MSGALIRLEHVSERLRFLATVAHSRALVEDYTRMADVIDHHIALMRALGETIEPLQRAVNVIAGGRGAR